MKLRYRLGFILIIIILGAIITKCYKRKQLKDSVLQAPVLKGDEHEKIIVDEQTHTITTITKQIDKRTGQENQKITTIEGDRKPVIVIGNNGTITVYAKSYGFIHEYGACAFGGGQFRVGMDTEWFYFRKWGIFTGIGVDLQTYRSFDSYIAIGYTLPKVLTNTSIFAGYSWRKQPVFGVRLKF